MKKCIFSLFVIFALSQVSYGQNLDNLMRKVSQDDNVESVKIGGFLMTCGKLFGGVSNMPVTRGIKTLEVYSLENCDRSLKKEATEVFNSMKDGNGYETLILAKEKKEGVRIMVKRDKNTIKEMVFLCMDKNDPAIIKFTGKIKDSDIEKLVNEYDK